MEINSTNSINAYTANSLDSGKSQVEDQNKASARADVSQQEAKAAQQAFEVNISQQAQALSNATNDMASQQNQAAQQAVDQTNSQAAKEVEASDSGQGEVARQKASQIVNIVA